MRGSANDFTRARSGAAAQISFDWLDSTVRFRTTQYR
jgi:hypothetical protein